MKNIAIILITVLIIGIASIGVIFFISPFPGDIVKEIEITEGDIGGISIGQSKQSILTMNNDYVYAPLPKPKECPKNWIEPKNMTDTQKKCLLDAVEWDASVYTTELCPKGTDNHYKFIFTGSVLSKIKIQCSKAI